MIFKIPSKTNYPMISRFFEWTKSLNFTLIKHNLVPQESTMQFHSLFHQGSVSWCHTSCSCAALTAIAFETEIFMRSYPKDGVLWFKRFLINRLWKYMPIVQMSFVWQMLKNTLTVFIQKTLRILQLLSNTQVHPPHKLTVQTTSDSSESMHH